MANDDDRRWVDSMPEVYERLLVPAMFGPFAADLARRVAAHTPTDVLELAAGTGALTRELIASGATVVATDLNPAMVAAGTGSAPLATWRTADATALPFDDASFDVVACQFGIMFFPDKRAAAGQVHRVLRDGGRFLFSTWAPVEEHDFAVALTDALATAFPDPPPFVTAIPHGYHDLGAVEQDLVAGGFGAVRTETVTLEGTATARDLAVGFCTGTPLRAAIEARGALDATVEAVAAAMEDRLGDGAVTGRMTAHVIEATRR